MTIFRKASGPAGSKPGRKRARPQADGGARSSAARSRIAARRLSGTSARARPAQPTSARTRSPKEQARPEEEGAPTDQRRRASAGRILGVGLLCFLLWLLFDANQLYHSAQAGQIGVRRTVAVSILRPIAAISNALLISGPVNAADAALGRCGIGGVPSCTGGPTLPFVTVPAQRPQGYLGLGAAPHLWSGLPYVPPPPPPPGPPQLVSPTASHPLTLLSIGDSIGEDLGFGLGDVFSTDPAVRVIQKGLEDTGLARSDYYNWPATLEADLRQYHPGIVVVMMGANDMQAFSVGNGRYLSFSMTAGAWWQAYSARVALVMEEATSAGAHVMWVGLPPMGSASTVPRGFPQQLNKIFLSQARSHPGVAYFPAAKVLSSKTGGFTEYLSVNGSWEQIRSSDGVHLLPPGYDLLAQALVQPMQGAWHVNLHVG
ncbi:MAG: DUF459 domain-containing protein [Acidimicrobiales bacterium]